MTFPRLMTAMITPYDENLKVNLTKAGELAEYFGFKAEKIAGDILESL